jgi:hypothetical protein
MRNILMIVPFAVMAIEPVMVRQTAIIREPAKVVSPGHGYYLSFEYGAGNTEYVTIDRFVVSTGTDEVVYEKTGTTHTILDIADNGTVVGIDFDGPMSGRARLVFYDRVGTEVRTQRAGFLLERAFSGDGSVYCVNDGIEGVRVFRSDGIELYNLGTGNAIAISSDGSRIAISRDDGIYLFHDGSLIATLASPSPFVRQMKFSHDGTLFGYITKQVFTSYDLENDTHLFQYEETRAGCHFTSFDIMPHTAGFICGLDEDRGRGVPDRHTKGYLYYIDRNGAIGWQDELHYEKWNINVPVVRVESEHTFTVSTVDHMYHYEY